MVRVINKSQVWNWVGLALSVPITVLILMNFRANDSYDWLALVSAVFLAAVCIIDMFNKEMDSIEELLHDEDGTLGGELN